MRRFGQLIRVRPEAIDEYERLHAAPWPGVLEQIRRSNIRNYSIYREGTLLFAYFEYVGDDLAADMQATRGWARTTVQTMLDRMTVKGLVTMRRVGNVKEFEPALKLAEARRSAWRRFVEHAFDGAVGSALQFIADDAKLTPKQREALRALLEEGNDD